MPPAAPPRLSDATAEQLREELLRRVPMHAPGWTDRDPSDPGVALIELFAWLASGLLGRMNELPAACHAELLTLLDLPARPARPAELTLCFDLSKGALEPVVLPCDPVSAPVVVEGGGVRFQTQDELCVLPVSARAAIKARSAAAGELEAADLAGLTALLDAAYGDPEREHVATLYETSLLPDPGPGGPPPAIGLHEAIDGALWIALLAPDAVEVGAARDRLAGRILSLGVLLDEAWRGHEDDAEGAPPKPAPLAWALSAPELDATLPLPEAVRYTPITVVSDETGGLLRSGVIRLQLPQRAALIGAPAVAERLAGAGALPPPLDEPALEERLIAWIRATPPSPRKIGVRALFANAVRARAAVSLPAELLGRATGQPGLELALSRAPVEADGMVLEGWTEAWGWRTWARVDSLGGRGGDDRVYALDAARGLVRLGDGVHGALPARGELFRARGHRLAGGAEGNVPAGAVSRVVSGAAGLSVKNPLAARGGRDPETLAERRRRAPDLIRHRDRAVSVEDFRALALEAPGALLGRVEVLPRTRPPSWAPDQAGVLTLVVLPMVDPDHPEEPSPDQGALAAVAAWLEPRRLVTTELCVTGPEYVPVSLSVAVEVQLGFGFATVRRWVELGLRQHFAPLPPYGPSGGGWPFGRDLRLEDVVAAALSVQGVRLVHDANALGEVGGEAPTLLRMGDAGPSSARAIPLQPWQLPVLRAVLVVEGETAPSPLSAPPTSSGAVPVGLPVPVTRERCG